MSDRLPLSVKVLVYTLLTQGCFSACPPEDMSIAYGGGSATTTLANATVNAPSGSITLDGASASELESAFTGSAGPVFCNDATDNTAFARYNRERLDASIRLCSSSLAGTGIEALDCCDDEELAIRVIFHFDDFTEQSFPYQSDGTENAELDVRIYGAAEFDSAPVNSIYEGFSFSLDSPTSGSVTVQNLTWELYCELDDACEYEDDNDIGTGSITFEWQLDEGVTYEWCAGDY